MYTSGAIYLFLATNGIGTIFRSLGSKPVVLSWDEAAKRIALHAVGPENTIGEVIFDVPVGQIEHAFIMQGAYVFKLNGKRYDMEVRQFKSQNALLHDLLADEVSTIASAYTDKGNDLEKLIDFLKQELPPQMIAVSPLSSRSKMRLFIPLTIAIIIGIAIFGAISSQG